jgi:predicted PurR-regulated permease PerM
MALGILYTLYFARSLILPIFIALLLAALLHPVVRRMNRLRVPETVAAGLVIVAFLVLVILAAFSLSAPVVNWAGQGPAIAGQVQAKVAKLKEPIEHARKATERVGRMAGMDSKGQKEVAVKGPGVAGYVASGAWSFLGEAAIVVILTYFFLARGRSTLQGIAGGFRDPSQGERLLTILARAQHDISIYLQTYALVNAGVALVVTLIMLILGMPTPLLWGVMAGSFNFIPYLGPGCALGVIALVSLLSFDSLGRMALPPLAYLCLIVVEGNFVTPTIMGNRLAMNPIAVFISILFWGWVWGVPGIFLAVPILATLKIVLSSMGRARPVHEALTQDR